MRSFPVVAGQNALAQSFTNLRADARGGSVLLAQQMLGSFNLSTNPTNTKTLTLDINGTNVVLTFVSSIGSTPGNVLIGASASATVANLLALLTQPQTTTATGVALSSANQTLVSYLSCFVPTNGTTLYVTSNNTTLYAPLTSFSASTNATSDSWTANTMALYVHKGTVYVNGTRVLFGGGASPTVTAPSSHPRIDVLTVDNTGTLAWTTGAENASPVAPTYPSNQVAICELYNVVGETALYDFDDQQSGQGYVYNDVRPMMGLIFNPAAIPDSLIPSAATTYDIGSSGNPWNNGYFTNLFVNGVSPGLAHFGGTGSDGALTISSGTTTINLGGAAIVIKNYTSISITGTGQLAFSNPGTNGTLIILRCQANVTLTSSATPNIDASGMGGAGGTAGSNGSAGFNIYATIAAGTGATAAGGATGGTGPGSLLLQQIMLYQRSIRLFTGAGGGGGNASTGAGGPGGAGGGALLVECGGSLNFTGTISVAGIAGTAGTNANNPNGGGGGGGGGAGGCCFVFYNSLTANSGSITVTGGTGGTGGSNTATGHAGGAGGSGGSGSSGSGTGGTGGAGNSGAGHAGGGGGGGSDAGLTNGSTGTGAPSSDAGGGGGGGASGYGIVQANAFFS